jgi:hypothetical protein
MNNPINFRGPYAISEEVSGTWQEEPVKSCCTAGVKPTEYHHFVTYQCTNNFPTSATCKCGEVWKSEMVWHLQAKTEKPKLP